MKTKTFLLITIFCCTSFSFSAVPNNNINFVLNYNCFDRNVFKNDILDIDKETDRFLKAKGICILQRVGKSKRPVKILFTKISVRAICR